MTFLSYLSLSDDKDTSKLKNQDPDTSMFKEFILAYHKKEEAELLRKASEEAQKQQVLLKKTTKLKKENATTSTTSTKSTGEGKLTANKFIGKETVNISIENIHWEKETDHQVYWSFKSWICFIK